MKSDALNHSDRLTSCSSIVDRCLLPLIYAFFPLLVASPAKCQFLIIPSVSLLGNRPQIPCMKH